MQKQDPPPISTQIHYKSLHLTYKPITLTLHRNFSTAHSTSDTRTNFFVRVTSLLDADHQGFGECGLPPKKPGCYMSDLGDCCHFMAVVKGDIDGGKVGDQGEGQGEEGMLIREVLGQLKSELKNEIEQLLIYVQRYSKTQQFLAPKCALQFSLLDLLTKHHKTTPTALLQPQIPACPCPSPSSPSSPCRCPCSSLGFPQSFYTASLQQNKQMLQNIVQHLAITSCIKIKYNNNIDGLFMLLKELELLHGIDWIIVDANCSWNLENLCKFLEYLQEQQQQQIENNQGEGKGILSKEFINKILYIEQPFALKISDVQEWQKIKKTSPIRILADQSFRNQHDLALIQRVAHAVNIKTQKTGGFFATYRAAKQAKKKNLDVMLGSMCSTQLGCTQTYQFYPVAQFLDVDGALLTKEPSLQGGFRWGSKGMLMPYGEGFGLRVEAKGIFQ